jgi:hypothetical protein
MDFNGPNAPTSKKCSEHLKELDRNVGETDADQTDANPGTDYKDICWQDGRRIGELKTLAEQLNTCDGYDTPLNLIVFLLLLKTALFGLKQVL